MAEMTESPCTAVRGAEYDRYLLVRDKDTGRSIEVNVGRYRVCCFATDDRTLQAQVVCVGLTGPDKGRHHSYALAGFDLAFRRVEADPVPARPVDWVREGGDFY